MHAYQGFAFINPPPHGLTPPRSGDQTEVIIMTTMTICFSDKLFDDEMKFKIGCNRNNLFLNSINFITTEINYMFATQSIEFK